MDVRRSRIHFGQLRVYGVSFWTVDPVQVPSLPPVNVASNLTLCLVAKAAAAARTLSARLFPAMARPF